MPDTDVAPALQLEQPVRYSQPDGHQPVRVAFPPTRDRSAGSRAFSAECEHCVWCGQKTSMKMAFFHRLQPGESGSGSGSPARF